jgi:hypothetical protein
MKRLCLALLLPVAALLVLAPAAPACINDRDIVRSEQEFKSRYQEQQPQPAPSSEPAPGRLAASLVLTGAVLMLGAVVVSRPGRR